jgi:hypothetical protein
MGRSYGVGWGGGGGVEGVILGGVMRQQGGVSVQSTPGWGGAGLGGGVGGSVS